MALTRTGRILYSITFLVLLPIALVAWAIATAGTVSLPTITSARIGLPLAFAGALLLLFGMRDLWVYGGGLPMNADPPPRYVSRGVYRLLPHPIYTGFCIICTGVSVWAGSASGLWLVTPVTVLGCAALVLGYERQDLRKRFGDNVRPLLPQANASPPSASDRVTCCLFVVSPWLVLYGINSIVRPRTEAAIALHSSNHPFLLLSSKLIYFSALIGMIAVPLVVRTRIALRRFAVWSFTAMSFAVILSFAVPLCRFRLPSVSKGAELIFIFIPSLAVIWAFSVVMALDERGSWLRWMSRCWAALVAVSCWITGQDEFVAILSGLAAVLLASYRSNLWEAIRAGSEGIANSWKEWQIGLVRVINHGIYVGVGAFVALTVGGVFTGPGHETALAVAALLAVLGAALWAQYVEGSPQLLRPYGFYGGLLGGTLGALIAPLFHTDIWLLLAAFSVGGPFGQGLGRLRCLVQGCCHGRPAEANVGIRYVHPRSRVCRFTDWTGLPLHPTPVYSLLWNGVVALVVIRMWTSHAGLHLIAGIYFILTGLGRFVEEAWRGEPQTSVVAGMRLYQWAAIASVIIGALFTALGKGGRAPDPSFRWSVLFPAVAFGLFVACAMSVDLPHSNRRFSRLV